MEERSHEKSTDELVGELDHPDPARRADAVNSLAGSGIKDQEIFNKLRLISNGDPDPNVRDAARKAILSPGETGNAIGLVLKSWDFWIGFIGWYGINGVIWWLIANGGLLCTAFFLNLFVLFLLARKKTTRPIALGVLSAIALNFLISLFLGMSVNGICLAPFFVSVYP